MSLRSSGLPAATALRPARSKRIDEFYSGEIPLVVGHDDASVGLGYRGDDHVERTPCPALDCAVSHQPCPDEAALRVERAAAGVFLTPPVVQPGVDQRAVPVVPAVPVGPKPRRTRGNGKGKLRVVRKYPTLSSTFFKGSTAGQINSVFKAREITPQKVSDYKQALANGACTLGNVSLSKSLIAKLQTLGIEVPATAD